MENRKKQLCVIVASALALPMVMSGCASKDKSVAAPAVAAPAPTAATMQKATPDTVSPVPADQAIAGMSNEKPGAAEGELIVVTAKVKAIDPKTRTVTLKYPDGKEAKIKCGPEVRNFAQIRVGDDVTAEFLESVEIFVTSEKVDPTKGTASAVQRAPLGSKPSVTEVATVEVTATVESIDYKTRMVKLRSPDGKTKTVKAGAEVKRLDEVKAGDTVVVRYTEAVSIRVTAPTAKK